MQRFSGSTRPPRRRWRSDPPEKSGSVRDGWPRSDSIRDYSPTPASNWPARSRSTRRQPWSGEVCAAKNTVRYAVVSARSPAPPRPSKSRYTRPRWRNGPFSIHAAIYRNDCPCRAPRSNGHRARTSTDDTDKPGAATSHAPASKSSNRDACTCCERRAIRRRGRVGRPPGTRRSARSCSRRN